MKSNLFIIIGLVLMLSPLITAAVDGKIGIDLIPETTTNFSTKSVNASDIWVTNVGNLDNANSTQFSGFSNQLNIQEDWLNSFGDGLWTSTFNLTYDSNVDTTIGNCSVDLSCSDLTYDSELTYTTDTNDSQTILDSNASWLSTFNLTYDNNIFRGTSGSIPFYNGSELIEDNSNLFWDDSNNRLGLGITIPLYPLHVVTEDGSSSNIASLGSFQHEVSGGNGGDGIGASISLGGENDAGVNSGGAELVGVLDDSSSTAIEGSFLVNLNHHGSWIEALKINENVFEISKKVGINTDNPIRQLDVEGSGTQFRISNGVVYTDFYTNALGHSSIVASGGKYGFGTYAPTKFFHVNAGTKFGEIISYEGNSGNVAASLTMSFKNGNLGTMTFGTDATGNGWLSSATANKDIKFASINDVRMIVKADGDVYFNGDNFKTLWGTSQDSSIYYNSTDMIINPKEVGSGNLYVEGSVNIKENLDIIGNFTGNQIYGEMWYHNRTGTALTFNTQDVFYPIWFTTADELNGFNFVGGFNSSSNLTAKLSGLYKISYRLSGSGQNNHIYISSVLVNSIEQEKCGDMKKMSAGGDVISMGSSCFINLNVNDDIQLAVMDFGGTGSGEYYSSDLNLIRIGE